MSTSLCYTNLNFHEKLGEGGYGTVARVTFKEPFMGRTEAAAKTVLKLRMEEVTVLEKLNHPNIVGLFGLIQEGPITIIVLEYAPHGTVHDYIKSNNNKPTPERWLRKWVTESAVALEYLHRNKVIHRDVKGSNCLLFEGYKLKLSDFGLARELTESMTTSSVKGTCRYMAPEIHEDQHYSFASDMWAYGMLVVEIASGKEPFPGKDWQVVVFQVTENNLKPNIPGNCPRNIVQILYQCWNRDPKLRPSAASVAVFLSEENQHEGSLEWNDTIPPAYPAAELSKDVGGEQEQDSLLCSAQWQTQYGTLHPIASVDCINTDLADRSLDGRLVRNISQSSMSIDSVEYGSDETVQTRSTGTQTRRSRHDDDDEKSDSQYISAEILPTSRWCPDCCGVFLWWYS